MNQNKQEQGMVLNVGEVSLTEARVREVWNTREIRLLWNRVSELEKFKDMIADPQTERMMRKSIMTTAVGIALKEGLSYNRAIEKKLLELCSSAKK